jgi:hypothetical protein
LAWRGLPGLETRLASFQINAHAAIKDSNPVAPTIFSKENEEGLTSRTDFAQNLEASDRKMKFPFKVRHRRVEAVIYAKTQTYPYYRLMYRAAGKRIVRSFATLSEARKEAEIKVREISTGNQGVALSAKEVADALAIRDALSTFRLVGGRRLSAIEAVTGYLDAVKLLPAGHNLADSVRG